MSLFPTSYSELDEKVGEQTPIVEENYAGHVDESPKLPKIDDPSFLNVYPPYGAGPQTIAASSLSEKTSVPVFTGGMGMNGQSTMKSPAINGSSQMNPAGGLLPPGPMSTSPMLSRPPQSFPSTSGMPMISPMMGIHANGIAPNSTNMMPLPSMSSMSTNTEGKPASAAALEDRSFVQPDAGLRHRKLVDNTRGRSGGGSERGKVTTSGSNAKGAKGLVKLWQHALQGLGGFLCLYSLFWMLALLWSGERWPTTLWSVHVTVPIAGLGLLLRRPGFITVAALVAGVDAGLYMMDGMSGWLLAPIFGIGPLIGYGESWVWFLLTRLHIPLLVPGLVAVCSVDPDIRLFTRGPVLLGVAVHIFLIAASSFFSPELNVNLAHEWPQRGLIYWPEPLAGTYLPVSLILRCVILEPLYALALRLMFGVMQRIFSSLLQALLG